MKPGHLLAAKYRLDHVLGSGAMGEVWAAVNETIGRPVAIKLMYSPTPELRARMLREARAVGTLKHKNIVDIYDVAETEGGEPFLVMERLSGETLADRLERVGPSPRHGGRDRRLHRCRAQGRPRQGHRPPRPQAGQHVSCTARRTARVRSSRCSTSG